MTSLQQSWDLTKAHLLRAAQLSGKQGLDVFREYLDHNELQLAADSLAEIGNERGDLPRSFWEALKYAYENMDLESDAQLCRFRIYEAEHGYIEARLTLLPTEDGGRRTPIFTDYRPFWNIGNRAEDDTVELNDARVSLEDCKSLLPGHTGTVRLHRIGQPYPTPPQPPGPDLLSEPAYDNSKACGSSAPPGLAMAKRAADSRY